ncbi:hypothetical protein [Actinomadura sp. NBRC 104425]|uniref:hypothetical protein n=1 Tax=Actinomadura sp. NBRC 104425 TaxID=3032204 RepID=UPI002553C9EA|nr:hypothetical protein [Actinomadura sp. NBRC 104425]
MTDAPAPVAVAAGLVAAYVDRDARRAQALVDGISDGRRRRLLRTLGALATSTRIAVSTPDGQVPGYGDARQLDVRVHEVLGQVAGVDTEAALHAYLQGPRDALEEDPAEVAAMVHAAAAYTAVLMESRPIPPTVLADGLREMARCARP